MEIRKTTIGDLARVMDIYAYARDFMVRTGNPNQWSARNWPPECLIVKDIEAGKSYVCEHEGRVVGVFFYDFGQDIDPTYAVIDGDGWLDGSPYGVVHRIAADGSVKGIGTFCINWALEQSGHLRVDTHEDNKVMQNLMADLGFTYCGIIHIVEDNAPRLAYEKLK